MKRILFATALWLASLSAAFAQVVTTREFPQGPTVNPLTTNATGTTGAIAATLTGVSGKFTYICGFVVTSAGTSVATTGSVTLTGVVSQTMSFVYNFVSSGQGVLGVALPGCITSSAKNTNITVNVSAGGAGTTVAATAWGYTN